MKKRILLIALMAALFTCIFAISVSAKDVSTGYFDLDGNEIVVPTYDEDGNALLWIRRDYEKGEPTSIAIKIYECTDENGTQYYLFSRKTSESINVDSNYAFTFKSGVGINNNIVVMNLDGITHSDKTGVQYFGFIMRNNILKYVYFPASIKSTKSTSNNAQVFLGDTTLDEVEFAPGSQITELGPSAFKSCAITQIVLPEGLTYIDERAFDECTSLKKIYIPKTVTFIDEIAFRGVTDATYYFTGAEETTSGWEITDEIQYVNHCDVYYGGEHQIGEPTCSRCGKDLYCENPEHNLEINITYENYMSNGVKTIRCLDCNSQKTESVALALFTCLGYSTRADGKGGLTAGYQIHKEALDEYLALNPTLTIGLIIVNADTVVNGEILDSDGALTGKGVKIENISTKYSVVNISIDGFNVENAKNLDLAMALYVKDENGYQYMQAEKDSSYYETRSFGDIELEVVTLYNVANKNGVAALTLSDGSITIS